MDEYLFKSDEVSVTPHIARFGVTSYQMANIGSVTIHLNKRNHWVTLLLFVLGGLGGALALATNDSDQRLQFFMGALALIGLGLAWQKFLPKKEYVLLLRTSSGDIQAYTTPNWQHISDIKQAVETGFTKRR